MRRYRCGKIVATVGPATSTPEMLEELFLKGADVFRLNFSHGTHEERAKQYESIRNIGKNHGCYPTILADLQGPKLRIGVLEMEQILLKAGDIIRFDLDSTPGNSERVNLPHPEILEALNPGACLLLDDGKLRVEVVKCEKHFADAKVIVGGRLCSRKGVNVPQVKLNIPILTEKDKKDLQFALELGVDWIACSFVQTVDDVVDVKNMVDGRAGVISKLEKPLAIQALEPIIELSDAVMVARGDLGVEMNPEEVPGVQRRIISTCRRMGKPVIVATHMLESMIASPAPTRAEVSDVATAVYSGADATMLSAESASGKYPLEAVSMMDRTVRCVESDPYRQRKLEREAAEDDVVVPHRSTLDAICFAAKEAAEYSCASVIVMFSENFESVVRCSKIRPRVPVILVTRSGKLANKVGVCYGIQAVRENVFDNKAFDREDMNRVAIRISKSLGFAQIGDNMVILSDLGSCSVEICQVL